MLFHDVSIFFDSTKKFPTNPRILYTALQLNHAGTTTANHSPYIFAVTIPIVLCTNHITSLESSLSLLFGTNIRHGSVTMPTSLRNATLNVTLNSYRYSIELTPYIAEMHIGKSVFNRRFYVLSLRKTSTVIDSM